MKKKYHFLVGLSWTLHGKVRVFLKGLRKSPWRKKAEERWNKPHRCCGQLNPGLHLCERDGQAICLAWKLPYSGSLYRIPSTQCIQRTEKGRAVWDLRKSLGRGRNWPLRVGSGVTKNAFRFWKLEVFSGCWNVLDTREPRISSGGPDHLMRESAMKKSSPSPQQVTS